MKKFQNVISANVFGVLCLVVACLSLIFYAGARTLIYNFASDLTLQAAENIQRETEDFLSKAVNQVEVTAELTGRLNDPQMVWADNAESIYNQIWSVMSKAPETDALYAGIPDGVSLYISRINGLITSLTFPPPDTALDQPGRGVRQTRADDFSILTEENRESTYDARPRPWFKNAMELGKTVWTPPYAYSTVTEIGITVSTPVRDKAGNILAVIGADFRLDALSKFIQSQRILDDGFSFIVDKHQRLVAFPDPSQVVIKDTKLKKARARNLSEVENSPSFDAYTAWTKTNEVFNSFTYNGTDYMSAVKAFSPTGEDWYIVVVVPADNIMSALNSVFLMSLLGAALVGLASMGFMFRVVHRISGNIYRVSAEAAKLANFNLSEIDPVETNLKEIHALGKSIYTSAQALKTFRKFVPPSIISQLMTSNGHVSAGGNVARLPIMVTNVQGFGEISKSMLPDDLLIYLSEYFERTSRVLRLHHATLDKYVDASMIAFWGRPVSQSDAALNACLTALKMNRMLDDANEKWEEAGKPPLQTGIALHYGPVAVGNIGSEARLNYGIMGPELTFTHKLEDLNAYFGTRILITDALLQQVSSDFYTRFVGTVNTADGAHPLKVFELYSEVGRPLEEEKRQMLRRHGEVVSILEQGDVETAFEKIVTLLRENPDDMPIRNLAQRCQQIRQSGNA